MRKWIPYTLMLAVLFVSMGFFMPVDIYAQTLGVEQDIPSSIVSCSGVTAEGGLPACNWCTFVKLIGNLIKYAIFLAVTISSLMFAYAGFLMITNNGNSGKVTAAWEIFRRTIYGIIGILAAWLIVDAIMTKVAGNEEWMSLECAEIQYNGSADGSDFESGLPSGAYVDGFSTEFDEGESYQDYVARMARLAEQRRIADERGAPEGVYTKVRDTAEEFEYLRNRNLYDAYCGGDAQYDATKCVEDLSGLNVTTARVIDDLLNVCKVRNNDECDLTIVKAGPQDGEDDLYGYTSGHKVSLKATGRLGAPNDITSIISESSTSSNILTDAQGNDVIRYSDRCGNMWTYDDSDKTMTLTARSSAPAAVGTSCF